MKKSIPVILAMSILAGVANAQYNHNPADPVNGPNHWGTLSHAYATCGDSTLGPVGLKQSPIDIVTASAVPAVFHGFTLKYKETPERVENTGHYIEVLYDPGSSLRIGLDTLDTYDLLQFHFHAPSEHTINGVQYDAEMHLVHMNAAGDIAVIGVFLQSSAAGLAKFNEIMFTSPDVANEEADGPSPVNVAELLPPDRSFYTYTGSLTTPDCAEGVRFFIFKTPVPILPSALAQLHDLISQFPNYVGYPNNNRPVLPLGSRTVFQSVGHGGSGQGQSGNED